MFHLLIPAMLTTNADSTCGKLISFLQKVYGAYFVRTCQCKTLYINMIYRKKSYPKKAITYGHDDVKKINSNMHV